jgi:hypothetical protein
MVTNERLPLDVMGQVRQLKFDRSQDLLNAGRRLRDVSFRCANRSTPARQDSGRSGQHVGLVDRAGAIASS